MIRRAAMAALILTAPPGARPDAPPPTEYEVKAAFLYNFARFVEWPPAAFRDDKEAFVIAILGEDPFGSTLDETMAAKTALGRRIEVKRCERVSEVLPAHIVFVSASERGRIGPVLDALSRPGVLTVGEVPGFAARGGIVNFVMQGLKVRFEINVARAEQARLKMSSQLLKLAMLVGDAEGRP